jgi:hypothetical protein
MIQKESFTQSEQAMIILKKGRGKKVTPVLVGEQEIQVKKGENQKVWLRVVNEY